MKRRKFLKRLCSAVSVATVLPLAIPSQSDPVKLTESDMFDGSCAFVNSATGEKGIMQVRDERGQYDINQLHINSPNGKCYVVNLPRNNDFGDFGEKALKEIKAIMSLKS